MLSRLVLRGGAVRSILIPEAQRRGVLALASRTQSTDTKSDIENVKNVLNTWEKAYNRYYGPERDYKNFPHPRVVEQHAPVRFGFVPESWFNFFYNKTGVTGPYLFGTGLLTYLLSKEIWIVEHNFAEVFTCTFSVWLILRLVGKPISNFLVKSGEAQEEEYYYSKLRNAKESCKNVIESADIAIWREEGQKHLFEAKRENVDLMLESEYRSRLSDVYKEVKKRLDYQVEVQNAKRQFEQSHMVQWIVENVIKGITPQQEKESISQCIKDLKGLAPAL